MESLARWAQIFSDKTEQHVDRTFKSSIQSASQWSAAAGPDVVWGRLPCFRIEQR